MITFNMLATEPSIRFYRTEGPWTYFKQEIAYAPDLLSGVIFAVTFGLN